MRMALLLSLCCSTLLAGACSSAPVEPAQPSVPLQIDPLLLAYGAEVWDVIAQDKNPIWPGWNASNTPILFYLPGKQDVLINFPRRVNGFSKFGGPPSLPGFDVQVRNGPTFKTMDGQNTSTSIEGVQTLVVADTLSNRRQQLEGWLRDPRPVDDKLADVPSSALTGDPYHTLCMIAHEAFHVFQHAKVPNKSGDESSLRFYPTLSVPNNVGFALEGDALTGVLRAADPAARRAAAVRWLAVRMDRRTALSKSDIDYEDGTEFNEGLAKYVEYRLLEVLPGRHASEALYWSQGFTGYENLSAFREHYIDNMRKHMRGEVMVNNDPFGASPLRMRLYFSGMAVAKLLDSFAPDWRPKILKPKSTLTELAADAIQASSEERTAALNELRSSSLYAELVTQKTKLEQDGQAAIQALLDGITNGPNTRLVIVYAKLKLPKISMSYTPFGVTRVDEHRTIYTLVPISVRFGAAASMEQTSAIALLQDREHESLTMQLGETVTEDRLNAALRTTSLPAQAVDVERLELPGVTFPKARMTVRLDRQELHISLEPRS